MPLDSPRPFAWFPLLVALAGCGTASEGDPLPADSAGRDTAGRDSADSGGEDTGCRPSVEVPYDGIDQDCDGVDVVDVDGDGWPATAVTDGTDCDDTNAGIHPGVEETCDWVDQDCNGVVDDVAWPLWYADSDGDGHGDLLTSACSALEGYVLDATDCDDWDADVHPGATERCNGRDDDCDGAQAPDDVDADADGQALCAGDCDDTEPRVATGNPELCGDGLDNDCEGTADEACADEGCEWTVPSKNPTIQDALRRAAEGATVCVEPGTYDEQLDFGGKAVVLVGLGGSAATVLAPGEGVTAVSFGSGEGRGAVLEGFTIAGGEAVWIDGASPTLVDVVVQDTHGSWGGGIHAADGAPALWDVVVQRASATYGVKEHGDGGGVYLDHVTAVLDRVTLTDNYAGSSGGGVYVGGSSVGFSNVVVRQNGIGGAWGTGAGLQVSGSRVQLRNVLVGDNATGWGWVYPPGGGLSVGRSQLVATNVTVCGNFAKAGGGGLYVSGSHVSLTNTIVCANEAEGGGGGIYANSSAVALRYSDVWSNLPDDVLGLADPTGTDGNVSLDPDFADSDYHLSATSPLLDAGDPTILDGDGSRSEMGAYGGPAGSW